MNVTKVNFVYVLFIAICISMALELFLAALNLRWIHRRMNADAPPDLGLLAAAARTRIGLARHLVNATAFACVAWSIVHDALPWSPEWSPLAALFLRLAIGLGFAAWQTFGGQAFSGQAREGIRTRDVTAFLSAQGQKGWMEMAIAGFPVVIVGFAMRGMERISWAREGGGAGVWIAVAGGWAAFCILREWVPTGLRGAQSSGKTEASDALRSVVDRSGLKGVPIRVAQSAEPNNKPNARADGIGVSRRIVIDEALILMLSPTETAAVIAHETGHLVHRHREIFLSWRIALGWAALSLAAGFGAAGFDANISPENTESLLILSVPSLALLAHPLEAAFIHRWEFQADIHAAKLVGANAIKTALGRIFTLHSVVASPQPLYALFHTLHPSPADRLKRLDALDDLLRVVPP